MIFVLATIELNPGTRDKFLKEFHALVPQVHAEAGCIEYGPAVDMNSGLPMQDLVGSDAVMVIEKWESLDALKAHAVAPHMRDYRVKVKDYVKDTRLKILEPA